MRNKYLNSLRPIGSGCILLALLAFSPPVVMNAQSFNRGEVSGFSGVNSDSNGAHPLAGGTVGMALGSNAAQLFFEPSYASAGALGHQLTFDGGVKVGFPIGNRRLTPYVEGVIGYSRYSYASAASLINYSSVVDEVSGTQGGMTYGAGGGLRCLLGRRWGIEPGIRWQRDHVLQDNRLLVKMAVFYQFGRR